MSKKKPALKVFCYSDIHWSCRDEEALSVAEQAQKAFRPDITVIGGDLLNCDSFSRHRKTLDEDSGYDYRDHELYPSMAFLDRVEKNNAKGGKIVFIEGNHDAWFGRWIQDTEGAGGLRSLLPSKMLSKSLVGVKDGLPVYKKRERFTWVSHEQKGMEQRYMLHPRLTVCHGWAAPKYAAMGHLTKAKSISVLYNHTQRRDYACYPLFDGTLIEAWCFGSLCKRQPLYLHSGSPSDWSQGFGMSYISRNPRRTKRPFTVFSVPIEKGCAILPSGQEVKA